MDKIIETEDVKEFIGKKYSTDEEKQEILIEYDEFQLNKLAYLNTMYEDDETKAPYWSTYNSNLHPIEKAFKKDIMKFSKGEIEGAIRSCIKASDATKRMMGVFCDLYCEYHVGKGDIEYNPCNGIILKKLTKNNHKTLATKIYGMDEFYSLCDLMKTTTSLANIKPLLLARYGIIGKQASFMRNLKWKDIDIANMKVNIWGKKENAKTKKLEDVILTKIPIDDRFVTLLCELQDMRYEQVTEWMNSEDYVIVSMSGGMANYSTINSRVNLACGSIDGQDRISFGDLLFTRQIEELLKIRKERKITTNDIKETISKFSGEEIKKVNSVKVTTLKDRYEELAHDTVHTYYYNRNEQKVNLELLDPFAKEFAEGLAEKLNLDITNGWS